VAILIPARNEGHRLEESLRSVIRQDYPNLAIRLLDDQSTDETLDVAQRLSRETDRLEIFQGRDHPKDWVGKPWALKQLADRTSEEWMLFLDADIVLHPQAVSRAMEEAQAREADLFSMLPSVTFDTFWQRVTGISLGVFLISLMHPALVNYPKAKRVALAAGAFLLFRRRVYEAIGGHESVKNRIVEDLSLALRVKEKGFRLVLLAGLDLMKTHFYGSLSEIWTGVRKNLYAALGFSPWRLVATSVLLILWNWLPWLGLGLGILGTALAWPGLWLAHLIVGGLATLLSIGLPTATSVICGSPLAYGLSLPLGSLMVVLMCCTSAWDFHFGRGVLWKGRGFAPSDFVDEERRGPG
jgi:glycosyltransferase involved in cell wall biosynthesis